MAHALRHYFFDKGQDTLPEFVYVGDSGSGGTCPSHCYCADKCQYWISNVSRFYSELGGDPTREGFPFPECMEPHLDAYLVGQPDRLMLKANESGKISFEVQNISNIVWPSGEVLLKNTNGALC